MHKDKAEIKKKRKKRIRKRIRSKLCGSNERPRVYVFKSNRYIYIQVINDDTHEVLITASTLEKEFRQKNKNHKNKEAAQALGEILVERIKEKKIDNVVLDRGIYPYHGRIKVLADAVRKGGITL